MPVSVLYVMSRWYHGALGYYHYCAEDFDEAEDEMDRAFGAVRNALEAIPFLVPLAHHCSDFFIQEGPNRPAAAAVAEHA